MGKPFRISRLYLSPRATSANRFHHTSPFTKTWLRSASTRTPSSKSRKAFSANSPDRYSLTTLNYTTRHWGYGPGAVCGWGLLWLSVVLDWSFHPSHTNGKRRPGRSADLFGIAIYPAFTVTDDFVYAMKLRGTEHLALAIPVYYLYSTIINSIFSRRIPTPEDVLRLGFRAINLTASLSVCYFSMMGFFLSL